MDRLIPVGQTILTVFKSSGMKVRADNGKAKRGKKQTAIL